MRKTTIYASVLFYRVVGGGLNELVEDCSFEATSKTDLLKQIRVVKKGISKKCKYCITGDKIYYKINYLNE